MQIWRSLCEYENDLSVREVRSQIRGKATLNVFLLATQLIAHLACRVISRFTWRTCTRSSLFALNWSTSAQAARAQKPFFPRLRLSYSLLWLDESLLAKKIFAFKTRCVMSLVFVGRQISASALWDKTKVKQIDDKLANDSNSNQDSQAVRLPWSVSSPNRHRLATALYF